MKYGISVSYPAWYSHGITVEAGSEAEAIAEIEKRLETDYEFETQCCQLAKFSDAGEFDVQCYCEYET